MANVEREALLDIRVDNGQAIKAIADYQKQIDQCKVAIAAYRDAEEKGIMTKEQAREAIVAETQVQKALTKEMKQVEYQLQKNIQQNTEQEGSLKSLRGELSQLTAQYDSLSRAEREGAKGQDLQAHIAEVYNELKKAEEGTGRFQRNVGNYTNKMVEGFGAVGGAAGGMINPIKNATMGLKVMSQTPIIAILGLLVNIISKVIASMKQNENAINSVQAALAPLNSLSTLFSKTLEILANGIVKVVEKLGQWLDKIGILKSAMQEEQQITKDEIALTKQRRQVAEANAKTEQQVAELKAKVAEKDKLTNQQRIAMWEEIAAKEQEAAERTRNLAQEELRVAEARAALTVNSAEDEDKLSQLRVAAINAETAYQGKMREINTNLAKIRTANAKEQAAAMNGEVAAEQQATKDIEAEIKRRISIREQEIQTRLNLVQKGSYEEMELRQEQLTAKYEADMRELEQQEGTQELMLLKQQEYRQNMQAIEDNYWATIDAQISAEIDAMIAEQQREEEAVVASAEAEKEAKLAAASAIGDALGALGNLAEQFGDKNKALAKAAKLLAIGQIAVETGVATAKGINQAQSVPYPANIAAIASTIATILAGMTSAIASVKSAKFAKGGLVVGEGTGTSDSIPARLSNGESVMTAKATSMFAPLLSAMNQMGGGNAIELPGSGNTAALEQAIARGFENADLSVSVREINTVQERMDRIDDIANV